MILVIRPGDGETIFVAVAQDKAEMVETLRRHYAELTELYARNLDLFTFDEDLQALTDAVMALPDTEGIYPLSDIDYPPYSAVIFSVPYVHEGEF